MRRHFRSKFQCRTLRGYSGKGKVVVKAVTVVTSAVHSQLKIMKPIFVPLPSTWTTIAFISSCSAEILLIHTNLRAQERIQSSVLPLWRRMKGMNPSFAGQTTVQIRKVSDSPLSSGRPVIEPNLVCSLVSISSRPLARSSRSHDHVLRSRVCHRWQDSSSCSLSHVQGRGPRPSSRYTIARKEEASLIHPSPQKRLHYLPHHVFQMELDASKSSRPRQSSHTARYH